MFSFKSDQSGAVGLLLALAAIPLLLVIGAAVDYGKSMTAKTRLQAALDAGALAAAASELPEQDRVTLAENVFRQNAGEKWADAQPTFVIGGDKVTGSVGVVETNSFMQLVGIDHSTVSVDTQVNLPIDRPAEVALVLDYSSSMNSQGKWQAMRDAALDLVDVLSKQQTNDQVKFALVPFAKMVMVDLPDDYVMDEDVNTPWTGSGCTQDRKWPFNTQDTTPDPFNDDTKWGALGQADGTCFQMASHNLEILPLTNNHSAVVAKLNAMDPYIGTHISLGLEFGWHIISDNEPFTEGVAYSDTDTLKVIVLLTDGRQTVKAWGQGDSYTSGNGEENLETMCEAIKDKGVMLITIAFDLNDTPTRTRLSDCATSSHYFFDADTNAQLAEAFEDIAKLIEGKIYVSR